MIEDHIKIKTEVKSKNLKTKHLSSIVDHTTTLNQKTEVAPISKLSAHSSTQIMTNDAKLEDSLPAGVTSLSEVLNEYPRTISRSPAQVGVKH
jgi:hypothetical protein